METLRRRQAMESDTNNTIRVIVIRHESIMGEDNTTISKIRTRHIGDGKVTTTPYTEDITSRHENHSYGTKSPDTSLFNFTSGNLYFEDQDQNGTSHVTEIPETNTSTIDSTRESYLLNYSYEFSLFLFFLILVGITLNLFFIRFLRSSRVLLTVKGTFWYSISVANLLLSGEVSIVLFLAFSRKNWPLNDVGCETFFVSLLCLTAFLNNSLAVLAIERCVFINKKSKEVSNNASLKRQSLYIDQAYKKYAAFILIGACGWALLLGLPPVIGWSTIHLDRHKLSCQLLAGPLGGTLPSYHIFYICGAVVFPSMVVLLVYFKHRSTVKLISNQLQNNRHRSSVVKLAMRVTRASTSSGPRQSVSSLSSVIIRDTNNFIRQPLSVEIQTEKKYIKYQAIWGTGCILASLPYILISLINTVGPSLPPESATIASIVYLCNPIAVPILIICLNDTLRVDFRKFLTATLCFVSEDFVPTAVVAPQAYRSGAKERRDSQVSRASGEKVSTDEDFKQKVERRRSYIPMQCSAPTYYDGPALTPIIERPSTSNYSPSPMTSPITHTSRMAEPLGRKDGIVVPPRAEEFNLDEKGEGTKAESPVPEQPTQPAPVRDPRPTGGLRDHRPTGGKRTHPLQLQSTIESDPGELPNIT